jgi:hypothetical protein
MIFICTGAAPKTTESNNAEIVHPYEHVVEDNLEVYEEVWSLHGIEEIHN